MFDTYVTIVGNVLTEPEIRRIREDQNVVSFRVASNSRRYDRLTSGWVDGPSLRLRVSCWRQLGESVFASVHVGDPVIVTGRLYTRDWMGDDKIRRQAYELNASAVGHDLARGVDKFTRRRATVSISATDDPETDRRVAGVLAEPLPELNNRMLTTSYDEELGGFITSAEPDPYNANDDPFTEEVLSGFPSGDDYPDEAARMTVPTEDGDGPDGDDGAPDEDSEGGDGGEPVEPSRKPRRRRQPVGV